MSVDRGRFARQIRLAEIGEAGQARLDAATVAVVSTGFAGVLEARYLRASGVVPSGPPADGDPEPNRVDVGALGLRHDAARDVAEGALGALVAIRGVLGVRADPEGGVS